MVVTWGLGKYGGNMGKYASNIKWEICDFDRGQKKIFSKKSSQSN